MAKGGVTPLLSCMDLGKWHGGRQLFRHLTLHLYPGDRIGLIGVNGSGKSTLLKILADRESADEGQLLLPSTLQIGYLPQESSPPELPVEEVVAAKLDGAIPLHERLTRARIQLGKVGFTDSLQLAHRLSGGWRKRLDLASALVLEPDLLILDEPTNHLDLEGTLWLERFLQNPPCPFIVVTHDRTLLERVARRIVELDSSYPDGLLSIDGNYSNFVERRELILAEQQEQRRALSGKVRREVDWLRRSPPARTTKSQARIQEAHRLQDQLSTLERRLERGKSQIEFTASDRQAKRLLVVNNLVKEFQEGGRKVIDKLTFSLASGERMAIVGANGSGKSTLLRIIAGQIEPTQGTIKRADGLKIVIFDQHREQLKPEQTLREALSPGGDTLFYRGQPIHVNGWASRFLFPPERLSLPVGYLSGGERARLLIARLMLEEADLLLLDEPTNDLDIPTLEVLEESLRTFPGALLLITHDRYLLDQVATSVLGLGLPLENPLFASYDQWELATEELKAPKEKREVKERVKATSTRLSYNEQRELAQMEETILGKEADLEALQSKIASMADPREVDEGYRKLGELQAEIDRLYSRWEELEERL